uniref:Uncharacterized protein n=1 Tax=Candidatus Kentrum sp. DK TaxID=2126562 RepID=A0A450S711_9GAMM|nr:MAG: hypothetical protein BECKDK2373B_GA0170837_10188 [Candidatus Kentron sp. DK]
MTIALSVGIFAGLIPVRYHVVAFVRENIVTKEATAKLELCFITRQKWSGKRSLHSVNEHFKAIFSAVREHKV